MNKNQADKLNYVARTGSHATKPNRRGDLGLDHGIALVTDEDPATQPKRFVDELDRLREETMELNRRLTNTLPREVYREVRDRRQEVGRRIDHLNRLVKGLNERLSGPTRAASSAYPLTFVEVARRMLPGDVFDELARHTSNAVEVLVAGEQQAVLETATMQKALETLPAAEKRARARANRRAEVSRVKGRARA